MNEHSQTSLISEVILPSRSSMSAGGETKTLDFKCPTGKSPMALGRVISVAIPQADAMQSHGYQTVLSGTL